MIKQIKHFFGIYTKDEKFTNGYNAMIEAINSRDWNLVQDLYQTASTNAFDFDSFDKGLIKAYQDHHNEALEEY